MDDGFIPSDQTIERTFRRNKNSYELSDRHKLFRNIIFVHFPLAIADLTHPL